MKSTIKSILKSIVPKSSLEQRSKKQLEEWKKKGCPVPPPHIVKQVTIQEYQKQYGHTILVETGTYLGDMVEAQKRHFNSIFSIELSPELFERAKKKFARDKNVTILRGDSSKVLPEVMKTVRGSAIFWLDGHYSAGITAKGEKACPVFEELDAIFSDNYQEHIILIDDARRFIGQGEYPTIEELTDYIKSKSKNYQVDVKHDIIRYTT